MALGQKVELLIFWAFRKLRAGHHKCYKVWHSTIINGLIIWVGFVFGKAWNPRLYCLKHVINTFPPIFLLIVIFSLYLLYFSLRHPGLTLNCGRIPIRNHGPCFPLSKTLVLIVIPNITWYKSNQHTHTIISLFPLTTISLVEYLSCLSGSSISDSSSRIGDIFWPILVCLAPMSCLLHCFLIDDVSVLGLLYIVINVVTQDKLYMICIIPRLVECSACNFAIWSRSSTSLLFFWWVSCI